MLKILLFIGLLITIFLNFSYASAETSLIIPLKKPSLTDIEIKKKISQNILKPLKKPSKNKNVKVERKEVAEIKKIKNYHLKFLKKSLL
jgi:soluble lytic murein transglycosylase